MTVDAGDGEMRVAKGEWMNGSLCSYLVVLVDSEGGSKGNTSFQGSDAGVSIGHPRRLAWQASAQGGSAGQVRVLAMPLKHQVVLSSQFQADRFGYIMRPLSPLTVPLNSVEPA